MPLVYSLSFLQPSFCRQVVQETDMTSSRYSGPSCHDLDNTLRIDAGSCRGGFDFSLLFEEIILEILPILLILILIPVRLWQLSQKRNKVVGSWLVLVKLVS